MKNVYQFNSRKLAQYIVSLAGEGREMPSPITVFGALNLNARNFEVELRRAAEKLENGMSGFLTQPVLSAQAVENLKKTRETLGERAKILAGILPVVSQRNAIFMENEVNGIHVDDAIIQRFEGLDRAAGEELGLEVSVQAAKAAAPYVDGFYLMTPFNRVALMERLIDPDAGIFRGSGITQRRATVRRTVLHKDQLKVRKGLCQNGIDTFLQIVFHLVHRHNDAEQWFFAGHSVFLPFYLFSPSPRCAGGQ